MAIRRKTIFVVLITLVALAVLAAVVASVVIDPDRYRPEVIAYLEAKTGKQIEIGHIGVVWIPLSIRLDDFGSKNPKPFPPGYVVKAKRIDAAMDASALLHREIVIKSLTLYDPVINVVSDPDGLWNFENPPSKTKQRRPIFALGVIPRVEITGGQVLGSSLIDPEDKPGPIVFEARNISATLEQVNLDAFSFDSAAPAKPAHPASGRALSIPVAQGNLKADSLRLGSIEVTRVRSKLRLLTKQVFFDGVNVEADRGRATGELSFNLSGGKAHFSTNVRLSGLDVARLLEAFPEGRGKMTGTMEGEVKLAGPIEHSLSPLSGIYGSGNLTVRNGDLPSLGANDNLKKMARFRDPEAATLPPSAFSSFSSDVGLASQRISSRAITIAFYGVDVECAGELGLTGGGTLDYLGEAKILKKQGFLTNLVAKMAHEAKEENGRLIFPIRVSGTMLNPQFVVTE
ncbi:MAG TPA: AsmA family protein [Terriglobales bacterium]|nr:AsmA family protein [Terriglobales bacterium]